MGAFAAALVPVLMILVGCGGGNRGAPAAAPSLGSPSTEQIAMPAEAREFQVRLRAVEVVGGSVEPRGGQGALDIDGETGVLEGLLSFGWLWPERVTLNRGFAGQSGTEVVHLEGDPFLDEWTFPKSFTLTSDDMELLNSGGMYVQASNEKAPEGAVRGQILPTSGETTVWFFNAFAMQVVPAADSSASASIAITAIGEGTDGAADGVLVHVNVAGAEDIQAVHLHEGRAGENGPVLLALAEDPDDRGHWFADRSMVTGAIAATVGAHLRNPNRHYLYVDVHTVRSPEGELRGQLATASEHFAALRGDDVVPPVETSRSGVVAVTVTDYVGWDWVPETAVHVNLQDMDDATAVTINQGAILQNGPVVHALTRDPNDPRHWSGEGLLLDDTQGDFEGFYVNVHTPAYPDGELRAQLSTRNVRLDQPDHFVVVSTLPADGSYLDAMPTSIEVGFSDAVDASSVTPERVHLQASGGDGSFRDGNERFLLPLVTSSREQSLSIDLAGAAAADDSYRLILDGSSPTPITDTEGRALGYFPAQGVDGTDFISTFVVHPALAPQATLARIQETVFTPGCAASGCHSGPRPPNGIDLSPGMSWNSLLEAGGPTLVEPHAPDTSLLVRKLSAPSWQSHPQGHLLIGNAQFQLIRRWIGDGATP